MLVTDAGGVAVPLALAEGLLGAVGVEVAVSVDVAVEVGDDVAAGTAERNALATGSRSVPADGVAVGTLGAAVTVGPPRRSAISSAMAVPPPVPAPESTRTRHGDDVVRGASASEGICFTA